MGWVSLQDVSNWDITQGGWLAATSEYISDSVPPAPGGALGAIRLVAKGTWKNGYRPLKIRITHNYIGGLDLTIKDKNLNVIASEGSLISGEEITINWNGYDLYDLFLDKYDQVYKVQSIEFLNEC
jgi:hypothetical protein